MQFEFDEYEIGVVMSALNLAQISASYYGVNEAWEQYNKMFEKIAREVH